MTPQRPNRFPLALLASAALVALAACSSVPATNARLDEARSSLRQAQANPATQGLPGATLQQAQAALAAAEAAQARGDDVAVVDHLAYLARQRAALLHEAGQRRSAEATVAQATGERDQLRLAARTREADSANQAAAGAQRDAQAAQRQTADARAQTADARAQAADAQRSAASAQRDASQSQQQAGEAERRAAALEIELRALDAKKTDRGLVVTIGDVLFDTDQAALKSGGLRSMDKLVGFLKAYPQRKLLIEGFTDSVGSADHNQGLSARRADAVRAALVGMGVGSDRLSAAGLGEAFPVAGNDSAGGRQMNRRVEIVLSNESGVITPR